MYLYSPKALYWRPAPGSEASCTELVAKMALIRYTSLHDDQRPNRVLQDTVSNLPSWLRRQTSGWAMPLWLLPSFVQERMNPKPRAKSAGSAKISTLDGLRGLACLMVMHMHWAFAVTDSNENGSAETNSRVPLPSTILLPFLGRLFPRECVFRHVWLCPQHQMPKDDTTRANQFRTSSPVRYFDVPSASSCHL